LLLKNEKRGPADPRTQVMFGTLSGQQKGGHRSDRPLRLILR
jgi:hypothetical protein